MAFRTIRLTFLSVALIPMALGLAGCGKGKDGDAGLTGNPIAKVAAPAGKSWSDVVAKTPEGGYRMGNPDAAIKLVEYGSLSCPHCARLALEGFQKLTGDYVASGRVSFEFRSFAIHPQDIPLTVLAGCGAPEVFIPLAEQIYSNFDSVMAASEKGAQQAQQAMTLPENQRFSGVADAMGFTEFFAARGISKDQAHACLGNLQQAADVAKRSDQYGKEGIDSTPTLLINGTKIPGNTWAELDAALQRAGARDK